MATQSRRSKYMPTFILLLVAALLLGGSLINVCDACTGWNTINPFCQAGALACAAQWGTIHLIMQILAVILIIIGVWRLIRIKN